MGEEPRPEINAHRIRVGGNAGGAIFAVGIVVAFYVAFPELRFFFYLGIPLGAVIAGILYRWHKRHAVDVTELHIER